ncbi:hypothetical protein B484DRAFT_399972 [Ochromonadaceae sp. CCMP2298]|nr:hypothetical protein B484DRAFT_399972 [Ochromonadaceae sp. CCMP2298]
MARNVPLLAPYTLDCALDQYTFECITYLLSDDERLGLLGEAKSSNSDTADLILSAEKKEAEDMEAFADQRRESRGESSLFVAVIKPRDEDRKIWEDEEDEDYAL